MAYIVTDWPLGTCVCPSRTRTPPPQRPAAGHLPVTPEVTTKTASPVRVLVDPRCLPPPGPRGPCPLEALLPRNLPHTLRECGQQTGRPLEWPRTHAGHPSHCWLYPVAATLYPRAGGGQPLLSSKRTVLLSLTFWTAVYQRRSWSASGHPHPLQWPQQLPLNPVPTCRPLTRRLAANRWLARLAERCAERSFSQE